MDAVRLTTAEAFLAATSAYRAGEPLRTNVLGSVATGLVEGSRRYDECFWWAVADDAGDVVGAAVRTPPWGLSLGPMDERATSVLAAAIARDDDGFSLVAGPSAAVATFLDAYRATGSPGSPRVVGSDRRDVLQVARDVTAPAAAGAARTAVVADLALATAWYDAFAGEVDGHPPRPSESDRFALRSTVERGRLVWWCRGTDPVAMAGHAAPVETDGEVVARVGPVYTPLAERRHGYGAAATAELTGRLVAHGATVMLFADGANATSNGVYRRLGYEVVDVFARRSLVAPSRP